MRQKNKISGNMRTLKRQYAARNWPSVRLLPDIAAYCRVMGPVEIRNAEFGVRNGADRSAYGPPGTAWYRLGPDKIFSPGEKGAKSRSAGLWLRQLRTQPVGVGRLGPLGAASPSAEFEVLSAECYGEIG